MAEVKITDEAKREIAILDEAIKLADKYQMDFGEIYTVKEWLEKGGTLENPIV